MESEVKVSKKISNTILFPKNFNQFTIVNKKIDIVNSNIKNNIKLFLIAYRYLYIDTSTNNAIVLNLKNANSFLLVAYNINFNYIFLRAEKYKKSIVEIYSIMHKINSPLISNNIKDSLFLFNNYVIMAITIPNCDLRSKTIKININHKYWKILLMNIINQLRIIHSYGIIHGNISHETIFEYENAFSLYNFTQSTKHVENINFISDCKPKDENKFIKNLQYYTYLGYYSNDVIIPTFKGDLNALLISILLLISSPDEKKAYYECIYSISYNNSIREYLHDLTEIRNIFINNWIIKKNNSILTNYYNYMKMFSHNNTNIELYNCLL